MKEKIKQYIGETLVILGTGLFTYNFFEIIFKIISNASLKISNYSVSETLDDFQVLFGGKERILTEETIYEISFFKADTILLGLTMGVVLLVAGILIIRNKKSKWSHERKN